MTEEQAAECLATLQLIYAAGLVCAKALAWFLGYCLWRVFVTGVTTGCGLMGKPRD